MPEFSVTSVQRRDQAEDIERRAPGRAIALTGRAVVRSVGWSAASRRPVSWPAIACSILAPPLFVFAWTVADLRQPATYNSMRDTISGLSGQAATDRWIMTFALLIVGTCYAASGAGLRALRPAARIDLVVAGVAGIGVAVCPQPANGSTVQHLAFTSIGATALAIFPALTARRRDAASPLISVPVATVMTVVFVGMLGWLLFEARTGGDLVGLAERLDSSLQMCWPPVLAIALYKTGRRRVRRDRPIPSP
jgi:hypothetical protein